MRHTFQLRAALFSLLLVALALSTLALTLPTHAERATAGNIVLDLFQAEAAVYRDDNFWPPTAPQDFYPKLSLQAFRSGGLPPLNASATGSEIEQRDWAAWSPSSQLQLSIDPIEALGSNIVNAQVQLWDNDDIDSDDLFDIHPLAGTEPLQLQFDVCTLRYSIAGLTGSFTGRSWMPFGSFGSGGARVEVNVSTGDGRSFLANNVAIANATPVQTVYFPRHIIDGKATAFMVELTSSHGVPVNGTLTVQMSDGMSAATDTRNVVIPPEGSRVFLFDGTGSALPYRPNKEGNFTRLNWEVSVDVPEDSNSPDPSGPFPNCVPSADNSLTGSVPMVTTHSPRTLYLPWDFNGSIIPGIEPVTAPPTIAQVRTTFDAAEPFRRAIFPISDTVSAVFPAVGTSLHTGLEPASSIFGWSIAAHVAGLDRLMLMPRRGWFAANDGIMPFGGAGTNGMSLGEFAPRAVIAEQGFSEVPAHEQGHTYVLSQRRCSTGGFAETFFLLGCRDEYTHTGADGRPYLGSGYDVLGQVYPTGNGGAAGSREVLNIPNFMDTTGVTDGMPYDRWIDNMSFDWLSEKMRSPSDPPLVAIRGTIQVEGGFDAPPATQIIGVLQPSLQFDGVPDRPEMALNADDPAEGLFWVRLVTPNGSRTYRFNPMVELEGEDTNGYGFFSFAIPWDPAATAIVLGGPPTLGHLATDGDMPNQQIPEVEYTRLKVSPNAPTIGAPRVGIGGAPDLEDPAYEPPTIHGWQDVVIAWKQVDVDPTEILIGLLLLIPPATDGELGEVAPQVPIAVDIRDGTIEIPARYLGTLPGGYGARLLVSDGVRTSEVVVEELFTMGTGDRLFLPAVLVK